MPVPVNIRIMNVRSGRRRVRIHFYVRSEGGPIKPSPMTLNTAKGPVPIGGGRGFIACQPKMATLKANIVNGAYQPTPCSDHPGAVTCDLCMKTAAFQEAAKTQEK